MGFFSIEAPPSEHIFRSHSEKTSVHEKFMQQWQKQVVTMQIAWQIFLMDVSLVLKANFSKNTA